MGKQVRAIRRPGNSRWCSNRLPLTMWQKQRGHTASMLTSFRAFRSYFQEQGPSIFQTESSKREQELEKQVVTLEQLLGKKELEIQLLQKY